MSIDRKPRTEQRWRDIINDCQESGQSFRSYCLRQGISEGAVGKSIDLKIPILNSCFVREHPISKKRTHPHRPKPWAGS